MANRESLMNALIELECKPTTYTRELLRKKWVEALTTAEFDPCDRLDGRTANKELSVYDAMMAEIMDDRNAEKAKVRNRRRADRKHPENKAERMRKMHNRLERKYGYYSNDGGLVYRGFITGELYADRKTRIAEKSIRSDWELESAEIEEFAMWERFNAELFEFDRQWREQAKAEQERVRKAREAIEFQEWLKWA